MSISFHTTLSLNLTRVNPSLEAVLAIVDISMGSSVIPIHAKVVYAWNTDDLHFLHPVKIALQNNYRLRYRVLAQSISDS